MKKYIKNILLILTILIYLPATQSVKTSEHNGLQQWAIESTNATSNSTDLPSIHEAVKNNNQDAIKQHLRIGTDINKQDAEGNTVLHIATQQKIHTLMQYLINQGADTEKKNDLEMTALHYAVGMETPATAKQSKCNLQSVKILIQNNADLNKSTYPGFTALHAACLFPDYDKPARILMRHGANVNARNIGGFTPVHFAAQHENKSTVENLIRLGAQVNANDNNRSRSPFSRNSEINNLLRNTRRDNAAIKSYPELCNLSSATQYKYAQTLILYERTRDTSLLSNFSVYSNLYHQNKIHGIITQGHAPQKWVLYATRCGHYDVLHALLSQPKIYYNINKIKDKQGNRALHIAAHYNRPAIATLLLHIANPNMRNEANQTAYDIMDMYNYRSTKKIFDEHKKLDKVLQRGTQIDNTDTRQHTTNLSPELLEKSLNYAYDQSNT